MRSVGLVLLASGESQRMGTPKQALSFGGTSLLAHAVQTAKGSLCRPVVVTLGAYANVLKPLISSKDLQIITVEDWQEGMNASIRAGIKSILEQNEVEAIVLMTCDQPYLTSALLNQLIEVYEKTSTPVVSCAYAETVGIPTLFDRSLFSELLRLPPGTGAKKLIASLSPEQITLVPFPQAETDVDTPEDYAKLKK